MKNHFFTLSFISLFCFAFLDCFSVPPPVPRPAFNTGTGFFVSRGKVYDNIGEEFIFKGVNHTCTWGHQDHNLEALTSVDGIEKTKANCVRLIFPVNNNNFSYGNDVTSPNFHFGMDETAEKRQAIEAVLAKKMVPIITYWNPLDTAIKGNVLNRSAIFLDVIVDDILETSMKSLLQQYESKIILNIANEWGENHVAWQAAYDKAIRRLRAGGIKCLLMIDAGGNDGQNPNSLISFASNLIKADSQKNIVFSLHMYAFWRTPHSATSVYPPNSWQNYYDNQCSDPNCPPYDVATQLDRIRSYNSGLPAGSVNLKIPLVIGEFSWEGCLSADKVAYITKELLQILKDRNIGWIAWSWNQNDPECLDMLKKDASGALWLYRSDADLTDFGNLIINHSTLGLKATARRPSIF